MQNTFKRALAVLLSLSILLSLGLSAVFVSAEEANTLEYPPPLDLGTPLTNSINCRDQVIFNNYNGTNYLYFSAGGTFYVFDVDKYAANPGASEPVFSAPSGINNLRGMTVDSNGVVYAVGDAAILMKYDPATNTVVQLSCGDLYDVAWGLDVDENDNVYIAGRTSIVAKYDSSTGSFSTLWKGDTTGFIRSLAYSNGYVYASRFAGEAKKSTMIKLDATTGELLKESAQISLESCVYTSVAGNVLFGGNGSGSIQVILDTETLAPVDIGVEGSVMGFVTKEHNGKAYFITSSASGNFMYSFDVATNTAEALEGFTDLSIALRCRDPFVTLTIDGTTYENCIMTCYGSGAAPRLFNLDTKTTTSWSDFTGKLTEAKRIQNIAPGGSNDIYIGGYLTSRVSVYNTSTKKFTNALFSNGHDQSDSFYWYGGKLYGGAYSGAYVYQYDPSTKEVTQLINRLVDDFHQRRIHEVTAGDNKIFFTTIPDTGLLGGAIGWYDLTTGYAWVVPEEGHLYYCKNPGDAEGKTWYNATDDQVTDVANMTFTGIVYQQTLNSLEYQNGLLYGTSSISGGTSSVSTQTEAKILVYDVANGQKLGDYSIRDAVTGIEDAEGKIPYISGIEADPDTAGKFWGVVDETLFSFTYDADSKTMSVKEEVSFAKNHAYSQNGTWKTGSYHWFPRPILFDGSGYMYVGFTTDTGIQKIKVSDPSVHEQVVASNTRDYVLGEDGNLYYMNGTHLMMVVLTEHGKVEQLIDAIGTVTVDSGEAIAAARAAYDALSDEDKAKVSNLQTLINAEAKFAELSNYKTMLQTDYSFVYLPPLEITSGSWVSIQDDQIAALAEAYENGTINSAYMGKAEGTVNPNQTNSLIQCAATYGQWLAFKLKSPGTGDYNMILNYGANSNNAKECSVYVLPGDTALADIETALASAQAVGTADLKDAAKTKELGSYTFEAGKDYIVVFKATKDKGGATTVGTNAQFRLVSLELRTYVVTADLQAAQAVDAQIDAIGEVTLESEEAIKAARAAYDALTEDQKALVTNLSVLTDAEAKLAELKAAAEKEAAHKAAADAVAAKIDAIGTVTLKSEEAIKAARAAYDALTDEQKALVSNLSVLTAAETALAALKIPQTGDATPMAAMLSLLVLSAAALSVLAIFDTRRKHI